MKEKLIFVVCSLKEVYQTFTLSLSFCVWKDTVLQCQAESDESRQQEAKGADLLPLALQVHSQRDASLKPAVQQPHPERQQGARVVNPRQNK